MNHHGTGSVAARVARRTFLADLGRATLGVVVLGPALAGCSDGGEPSDDPTTGAATEDGQARSTTTDDASSEAASGTAVDADGGTRWERASYGFVSAYVVVRDGEALVFDTGTADGGTEPIADALAAAGVGWDAVGHVLVSHAHPDHVGGLDAVVSAAPDATVHGAMPDLDEFRDRVPGAQEVVDGDTVLGLQVVATPGHTLGHVAAFEPVTGLLLAGDAIVNEVAIGGTSGDGIEQSPPEFTADAQQAAASLGVLAELRPATILFGHGEPVTEDAADRLGAVAGA